LSASISPSVSPSPSPGTTDYYRLNRNFFIDLETDAIVTHLRELRMPIWGSSNRPSSPKEGDFGYNAETSQLEIYDGSTWNGV
jgi:hypothetical protein